jgi:hypothetical protein
MIGVTTEFKEMLLYIKEKFKKSFNLKLKELLDPNFIS